MIYTTGAGFRQALERRINEEAAASGIAITRLRKLVAFDRLLARLVEVAPNRWIAKGGLVLNLRFGNRARTTIDLDLARQDSHEASLDDLRNAAALDTGDFFAFVLESEHDDEEDHPDQHEERGERYRVVALLGGRTFEALRVDVGFGDPLPQPADFVSGIEFLAFAGLAPIMVPVLPLEEQIAQKLHAYSLLYGGRHPSSRIKDLVDIVLICSEAVLAAGELRSALERTFRTRGTHPLPMSLPDPPTAWERGYGRLAADIGIDPSIRHGHALAAAFIDPILSDTVISGAVWDSNGRWSDDLDGEANSDSGEKQPSPGCE